MSPGADEALATLCGAYWYPLYAFLRRRGYDTDAAQDLTQAFFARLLERERRVLRQADPERGRFRSFLLSALRNFAANEHERSAAQKRGGGAELLSLDFQSAEDRFRMEPPSHETPERVFDRQWAVALLERAIARLRAEMSKAGKDHLFEHLKMYLTGERPGIGYAEVAAHLGMSEGSVKVAVHRLRRHFRALVQEEIAQTVSSAEDVADEMRHLWSVVSR